MKRRSLWLLLLASTIAVLAFVPAASGHDGDRWVWSVGTAEKTLETARWPDHREVDYATCTGLGAPYRGMYKHFRCKLDAWVIDKYELAQANEDLAAALRFGDPRLIRDAEARVIDIQSNPSQRVVQHVTLHVLGRDRWTTKATVH